MVLRRTTSLVLTGLDKGDEIINKTSPLLVSVNITAEKATLQTVFLGRSVSSQQTRCLVAKACELSSPLRLSPLCTALVISAETYCTQLPHLKSGVREGPLAPHVFWTRPGIIGDSPVVQHGTEKHGLW